MDDKSVPQPWPESMLTGYSVMLSVTEVAEALNVDERNVRTLLSSTNGAVRLPGVKIGKSWRIARDELGEYLRRHHNNTDPHHNTDPHNNGDRHNVTDQAVSRVRPS